MTVQITDLASGAVYIARSVDDCYGVDRHLYQMVCQTGRAVSMGLVIAEPIS